MAINALAGLKDQIDRQIAQVQSDIGQFLMQKTRILNMPDSLTRSSRLCRALRFAVSSPSEARLNGI